MPAVSADFSDAADYFLADRHWQGRAGYTVLQTGGAHLRQLLQIWSVWQQQHAAGEQVPQRLHYFMLMPPESMPARPLPSASAPLHFPDLLAQLQAAWPPATPGYHRLLLAQGRLLVTLIVATITTALVQLEIAADCFLLHDDAALWTPARLTRLGRLAAAGAQLYAPQQLDCQRAALQQAGFVITSAHAARFAPRWPLVGTPVPPLSQQAIVIGAGLAGSAACERLTARGWQVTLVERHAQVAQEASGNLAGVYMPSISRDDNPTARLTRAAFLFARQLWSQLGVLTPARGIGAACGVLHLARDAAQAQAFEEAARHWHYPAGFAQWLSSADVSARFGVTAASGWWFPGAGWLRPALLCEALLEACGSRLQRCFHHAAISLRRLGQEWQVCDAEGGILAQAAVLILANGCAARDFEQAADLPLQSIRGQVSHVPLAQLPSLPMALCGDGYLAGPVDGMVCLGASYDLGDADRSLRLDSHADNLGRLRQMLPQWQAEVDPAGWSGRVGFRCVAMDRLPLIGALPDMKALVAAGEMQLRELPRHPQLYGLLAYASRGLIWAPLAAEIVACRLNGEPPPLSREELALLDPARFALKAHRRSG